jgi:Tfp pilus assembly protein PilX
MNMTTSSQSPRGFTLLIAVVLTSVMLSVGLSLAVLAYKDVLLSSSAKSSAYAFYSAESALECALYADQKQDAFDYDTPQASITCGNQSYAITQLAKTNATSTMTVPDIAGGYLISFDGGATCATLTVFKGSPPSGHTQIFATGYSSCNMTDPKLLERGLKSFY